MAMRKVFVLFATAMVVLVAAAPAFAQRDPFAPQEGSGSTEEPSGDDDSGSTGDPTVQPDDDTDAATDDETSPNQSDQLANTGANPEPWLVIAYALFAAGAAALFVSKVYSPIAHRK